MAVLTFTPCQLEYVIEEGGGINPNGSHRKANDERQYLTVPCNMIQDGQPAVEDIPGGKHIGYTYTIHLPVTVKDFRRGEQVIVHWQGKEKTFRVLGFQRLQLQCKIWV